jgi:hypothetical protein
MNNSRSALTISLIAALFIFLFTYTAFSKLLKMEIFSYVLSKSPLIGKKADLLSWCIVITEWITVLLLVYQPIRIWGLYLSLGLMLLFAGYIFIMLQSSAKLPCSCGGVFKELTWRQHFIFNIFFALLAALGIGMEKYNRKTKRIMTYI